MDLRQYQYIFGIVVLLVYVQLGFVYFGVGFFVSGTMGDSMEPTYENSINVYESVDRIESVSKGDIVSFSTDDSWIPTSHRVQYKTENTIHLDGDHPFAREHTFTHSEFEDRMYGKAIFVFPIYLD
jgi:signal peptidase I